MKLFVLKNKNEIGEVAGNFFFKRNKRKKGKVVFGMSTGSTPIETYKFLIKDHKINKTDWSNVVVFNLDEYVGLKENNKQSYIYFMNENLFKWINISKNNIFIPKGTGDYLKYASKYDFIIKNHGGIDIQLLGLGQNGHIGFNEPPANFESKTGLVKLTDSTIKANSRFFKSIDEVRSYFYGY